MSNETVRGGTLLESSLVQVREVMDRLALPPAAVRFLTNPQRETRFQFPVKLDDGSMEVFEGFRVRWNMARGPAKGGLRFHPDESIDTVRMLAAAMAWKTAVMDLPLGGGKGGVVCDPRTMSLRDLEAVSRGYIRAVAHQVGPDSDVPAPDVYTDERIMAWMEDEYEFITNKTLTGVVTGKPVELGGSKGRKGATARGGVYAVREAGEALGLDLRGGTAAIQGYGKVGRAAHELAADVLGMKVVAVSDTGGAIHDGDGLDPDDVGRCKDETGSVAGLSSAERLDDGDLLALDVDVLFPCALEHAITEDNAADVRATIVAELANTPTTPGADEILHRNDVFVLPDILCNAGGVTVSYFEQVQNRTSWYWDEETVHERLDGMISGAFRTVHETAVREGLPNRLAAYQVAIQRIYRAMELRGWMSG